MEDYIKYRSDINSPILYSNIVYKKDEYELFSDWFENAIKTFKILKFDDTNFSVILEQNDYCYDWLEEVKTENCHYGDGHCYEDAFRNYIE